MQRVKLNGQSTLYEQSSDADSTMIAGHLLRDTIQDAILNTDNGNSNRSDTVVVDFMDDDEAEEARKYFGVF